MQPKAAIQPDSQALDVSTLPEVFEMPVGGTSSVGLGKGLELAARMAFSSDPEEIGKIFTKALPGSKIVRDKENRPVLDYDGRKFALNKPGMSWQDIVAPVSLIATNVGLGKFLKMIPGLGTMAGFGARAGREMAAGTITGAASVGARAAAGGEPKPQEYVTEPALGAAGGLAGELLATSVGTLLAKHGAGILDGAGKLTATARAAFRQAGIDADGLNPDILKGIDGQLRGRVVNAATVAAARRQEVADAYGMPLTKGEATRDLAHLQAEEAMRQGARGEGAQSVMRGVRDQQISQAPLAIESASQRVAPGATITPTEAGAGDVLVEGVRGAERAAGAKVGEAYKAFRGASDAGGYSIPPEASADLTARIGQAFRTADFIYDPTGKPAGAVVEYLRKATSEGPITPEFAEELRKRIGATAARMTDPQDRAALNLVKRGFDDWFTAQMDAIPSAGTGGTMDLLRQARATAAAKFRKFESTGAGDKGGALVERIVAGRIEPQGAIDAMMGGARGFDVNGAAGARRVRDVLGAGSQQWQTMQRAMIRRILLGGADQQATGFPEWQTMLARINRALEGRGEDLAADALGRKGIEELRGLRDLMGSLAVPSDAMNRSGSGWALMRALQPYIGTGTGAGIGGALGAALGGSMGVPGSAAAGAAAGGLAGKTLQNILNHALAVKAAKGYRAPLDMNALARAAPAAGVAGLLGR